MIVELFSLTNEFGLSMRANNLLAQHERNYLNSRIISDIRPVFAEDEITEVPKGAVISHALKIEYMEGFDRRKEFFVGLDESELKEIKVVIERAEEKAKSLREMIAKSKVPYIKAEAE
jgi:hypothetical protein